PVRPRDAPRAPPRLLQGVAGRRCGRLVSRATGGPVGSPVGCGGGRGRRRVCGRGFFRMGPETGSPGPPGGAGGQNAGEPAWRRRGVGLTLMRAALDEARARAMPSVELSSWAFNTDAHAMFRRLGFGPRVVTFERDVP